MSESNSTRPLTNSHVQILAFQPTREELATVNPPKWVDDLFCGFRFGFDPEQSEAWFSWPAGDTLHMFKLVGVSRTRAAIVASACQNAPAVQSFDEFTRLLERVLGVKCTKEC